MRRALRWPLYLAAFLLLLLALATGAGWLTLRASLPQLDGEVVLAGLSGPATITRDAEGIATIATADRIDLARALGFVHAQERWFEMDLTRRAAAGELAALFGAAALPLDRDARVHRFRARTQRWLAHLPGGQRELLEAYADGANAGLSALGTRPWPYLLLRQSPQPWQAEDSLLAIVAMFFDLQDQSNERERRLDTARRALAPGAFDFIVRAGTAWDAPLLGDAMPEPPLPTQAQLDLRAFAAPDSEPEPRPVRTEADVTGSNSFAVAGTLTPDGCALVANDMHLGLRVPNIWFRARLVHGAGAARVQLDGLTLPGAPGLVAGSNGHVAWAFTNSYGDWLDLVRLEVDQANARYRTADGWREFEVASELIASSDGEGELLDVRETIWGPVIGRDVNGATLALAWTAHRDGAVDATLLELEAARDVDAAMAVAQRAGIPVQNFVVGDAGGRIGWTLAGRMPARRAGHDPAQPVDGAGLAGDVWNGWLPSEDYPAIVDPASGRLWTANARVVGGDALAQVGDGGYDLGARAMQIRDGLLARERFAAGDLLAIQLDDRALFMLPWWRLLRETIDEVTDVTDAHVAADARAGNEAVRADRGVTGNEAPSSDSRAIGDSDAGTLRRGGGDGYGAGGHNDGGSLAALDRASATWDGCACVDSVSYRLARAFRSRVHDTILSAFARPVRALDDGFRWPTLGQFEGAVWQLLRERPAHLLPQPYDSWDALLRAQALAVADALSAGDGGLSARTWGEANTARIRHPLADAMPRWLAAMLSMPAQPLPGDSHMPRVQGPSFGASQRSVIAPGNEEASILHMPGGQSGHPLSIYFGAGHEAWANGEPKPLVPGSTQHTLHLRPQH